jgi:dTDP-glucose 4,6-dehydratase
MSSGSVYGSFATPSAPTTEDSPHGPDPLLPGNALAEAKRLAENAGMLVGRETGLGVVVARGFAMCGPWLPTDADFALGNFIGDALAGRPIRVSGDGTPIRSFLYGSDVAAWLWTILLRGTAGQAYNVGSESPVTIMEAAQAVSRISNMPVERAMVPVAGAAASWYVPSTRRSREELRLEARVAFEEGVERMLEWHRGR